MTGFNPTPEQKRIGRSIDAGYNVLVKAVSGAGKTWSALYIADIIRRKFNGRTLILLYNRRLASETQNKITPELAPYVEATTIHSFAVRNFGKALNTNLVNDELLDYILENPLPANQVKFDYRLIIIDEAQDLVELYKQFIVGCVFRHNTTPVYQVAVYGDLRQTIYAYNGADSKYLEYAHESFTPVRNGVNVWKRHKLSVSFRVPSSIAEFINNVLLKETVITAYRQSTVRPVYAVMNVFAPKYIVKTIESWLKKGYRADDIFVLTPSTRSKGPFLRVLNTLTDHDIAVYVLESNLDPQQQEQVMKDKIVFTTFHKAKGLERKCVIVYGFDESYFEYYNVLADPLVCPNELYVAVTRASCELVVIANRSNAALPFLDEEALDKYAHIEIVDKPTKKREPKLATNTCRTFQPSYMSTTSSKDELAALRKLVTIDEVYPLNGVPITLNALDRKGAEDVSDLNGNACTLIYEYAVKGQLSPPCTQYGSETRYLTGVKSERVGEYLGDFVTNCSRVFNIESFLKYVTALNALTDQMFYRLFQIKNFNWLSFVQLGMICKNMHALVRHLYPSTPIRDIKIDFEHPVSFKVDTSAVVNGQLDMLLDDNIIVEIKCVNDLLIEHVLQTVFYMYAKQQTKAYLYNVRKNHLMVIRISDLDTLDAFVRMFIGNRVS